MRLVFRRRTTSRHFVYNFAINNWREIFYFKQLWLEIDDQIAIDFHRLDQVLQQQNVPAGDTKEITYSISTNLR